MKNIILLILVSSAIFAKTPKVYTYVPEKAPKLIPEIYSAVDTILPGFQLYAYFPALVEQESCLYLTHRRCFSATSRLYAKRKSGQVEEGAGVMMLTRVRRKNGKLRFDTLTNLVRKYPYILKELNWKNVYRRPDLQVKAGVLLWRDNYNRIKRNYGRGMSEIDLIAFADSAYNGGYGGLRNDIRKCQTTKGCNRKKWFGNVEKACSKSKRTIYGKRSACFINREHVENIFKIRLLKYYVLDELTRQK